MLKKFILSTAVLSALMLNGCGGDSKKQNITEQLKQRDGILIIHSTKNSACSLFVDQFIKLGVKNVIFDSPKNTVSCTTYGKVRGDIDDDNAECAETTLADFSEDEDISTLEDDTKACVIGGNN